MCLCAFVSLDEDALICDFAETYRIYDWRSLPGRLAATLAAGLRQTSRIRMKAEGVAANIDTSMLALLHDDIAALTYYLIKSKTRKHVSKPISLAEKVIHGDRKQAKEDYKGYEDSNDYLKAWERLSGN